MVKVVLVAGLLLATLVAGCANDPTTSGEEEPAPAAFEDVVVTDTTGAIRGVVVTEAIVPIEGALVVLAGGKNQTSDADGAFVFNGLEPGDYFLTVSSLGYHTVQTSATVVAGDKEPAVTKVTLLANPQQQPFAQMQQWDGYVQCAFMVGNGALGAQACGPLDERFIHWFTMDEIPQFAQAEMVWTSTQTLGNAMDLEFYDGGTWHFKLENGESPIIINATKEEIVDWWSANETQLPMRAWPSGAEAASVTINQQFTVYMTMFYNFVPRTGWTFIEEGVCDVYTKCI